MIPEPWWIGYSCSDRLTRLFVLEIVLVLEQTTRLFFFFFLGPQLLVIHLSTSSPMLGKKKEKK